MHRVLVLTAALILAPAASVHADEMDVMGWKKVISPFSKPSATVPPVTGSATIDRRTDAAANVTLACSNSDRITVTVGIANAKFDLGRNDSIDVQEKLDDNRPTDRSGTAQNSGRYSYESYLAHNFVGTKYLLLQMPINGEDQILKIPFDDPIVIGLVSQCAKQETEYTDEAKEAKIEEEKKKTAKQALVAKESAKYERSAARGAAFQCYQQYSACLASYGHPRLSMAQVATFPCNVQKNACNANAPREPNGSDEYDCTSHRLGSNNPLYSSDNE